MRRSAFGGRLGGRALPVLLAAVAPVPAAAHDAFGDMGSFYASLLHPLADPLQAAIVAGAAAVLAARAVEQARSGLPLFLAAAALAQAALAATPGLALPPLAAAAAAVALGLAAAIPSRALRRGATLPLLAVAGALAGLAPGAPPGLSEAAGTILGIACLATLAWAGLDTLARRVSVVAPAVAGSWVAAVGLLAAAFAVAPPPEVPREAAQESAAGERSAP